MELQQEIEIGGRGISPTFMRLAGGALKIRFVEIHHVRGRTGNGHGSGFENFVIQRDGQFCLAQTGADAQSKFAGNGAGLRDGFAPDGIHDGSIGQFDVLDNEAAMKPEVFELPDVNHGEMKTLLATVVHPKMDSGKESVANAEFGLRILECADPPPFPPSSDFGETGHFGATSKSVPFAGAPRPLLIHALSQPGLLVSKFPSNLVWN